MTSNGKLKLKTTSSQV